jgi:hypothetical protein
MKMDFLRVAGLIFLGGWVSAAELLSDPWFVETAAKAGVTHRHHKRKFSNPYAHIMQGYTALGAAVAVADFDGDGWDDFYLTDSGEDGRNALYRNNGDFTFTDVANRAGVAQGNDAGNASSDALWFDYDNDARPDLFVVRFGSSLLYRNLGEGRFKEVSKEAGLDRYANAMTAIAFDTLLPRELRNGQQRRRCRCLPEQWRRYIRRRDPGRRVQPLWVDARSRSCRLRQ